MHLHLRSTLYIYCMAVLLLACNLIDDPKHVKKEPEREISFTGIISELDSLAQLLDQPVTAALFQERWDSLRLSHGIPFIVNDSVAFFYKGNANSVRWNGDFNGWGARSSPNTVGRKMGKSDLWILKMKFPTDARLDYKIVVNGSNWILDPLNPYQQWGGAGPNSELRMPTWKADSATFQYSATPKGILSENIIIESAALGYKVQYKVYTPAGYSNFTFLPVIYITDGHEYADPRLGAAVQVLDNLIAWGDIHPVIAVFVDPRTPDNLSQNRRQSELTINPAYLNFFRNELVPVIDAQYKTDPISSKRAILGTSLGGLNAAYFGAEGAATFGLIGIHSPAFWYKTEIYGMFEFALKKNIFNFYMSTGVINDTEEGARQMNQILLAKNYHLHYYEVNEGHSWGNWRGQMSNTLKIFFGKAAHTH